MRLHKVDSHACVLPTAFQRTLLGILSNFIYQFNSKMPAPKKKMPGLKRKLESMTDSAPDKSTKPSRNKDQIMVSTKGVEASLEQLQFQARSQVNDFAKYQYPVFECGRDLGYFALATQEDAESAASAASLSWLSKYHTSEMTGVSCNDIEDHIGILVAAALSGTNNSNVLKTADFIAYNVSYHLLGKSMEAVKLSPLLSLVTPEARKTIEGAWKICNSLREQYLRLIQHIIMNGVYDDGITIATCKTLWNKVQAAGKHGDAIRGVISAIDILPPSTFKQSFEDLRSEMEYNDPVLTAASTKNWCLGSPPTSHQEEPQISDLKTFIEDCQLQIPEWDQDIDVSFAPGMVEDAVVRLQECIDRYSKACSRVRSLPFSPKYALLTF